MDYRSVSYWFQTFAQHAKFFSCESHKKSCIVTRFFGKKGTHEKLPRYTINRVFWHNSLGPNLMVFCVIHTNDCVKKEIFRVKNTNFGLETARNSHMNTLYNSRKTHIVSHVFQLYLMCAFTREHGVFLRKKIVFFIQKIGVFSHDLSSESSDKPLDWGRENRVKMHDLSCNWAITHVSLFTPLFRFESEIFGSNRWKRSNIAWTCHWQNSLCSKTD